MIFAKAGWRIAKPRPAEFLGEPIQWVDTARYLGVILDSRLNWSPHIVQVRKKAAKYCQIEGADLASVRLVGVGTKRHCGGRHGS